jgi:phosphoribosyl-ATP pyrophosphohydrolase/phosphoribosyl-AMP cyclohydrolase
MNGSVPPAESPLSAAAEALIQAVKFDPDGLVPTIAQDAATGVLRMVAWASAEALRATFAVGQATFWSRSRQQLWRKGSESGHVLPVREVRLDCDGDAVLYLCDPVGPSCHTGRSSCFYRSASATDRSAPAIGEDDGPAEIPPAILSRLFQVVKARRQDSPESSYVASLLTKGVPKINSKILEEAQELTEALTAGQPKPIAHEAADLLFHLLVGLEATGLSMDDVFTELRRRFGVSGHQEKAGRTRKSDD